MAYWHMIGRTAHVSCIRYLDVSYAPLEHAVPVSKAYDHMPRALSVALLDQLLIFLEAGAVA
jgi:hypothetical protein